MSEITPADSALLEYVANGFDSGDYQGDYDHAREIVARLRARAAILKREEDADYALTEVIHFGDVVARFRRVSEARKHVREVMDAAGASQSSGVTTYPWQLGSVITSAPMSGDAIRIEIRHPLPPT